MAVPANICIAWPSTAASIPSGWTRETALDARYILGAAAGADTDLVTDRGNTTHTHTSPSHTPTQNAHVHSVYALGNDGASLTTGTAGGVASDAVHGHNAKDSALTTAVNNGVAITVNATSNDLAFIEVIWIKSDGTPTTFPSGCIAFFGSDTLPASWSRVQSDRYLKGAAAAGNGGTTGGSNTHTHTSPAHTHTQVGHSHSAVVSLGGNASSPDGTGTDSTSTAGHTHSISLLGATATNQAVTTTINSGSHEPPFLKLNVIQSAAATLPTALICLWLGTNATIPTDWTRYTAMDGKWLKGAALDGESTVTTGGASQHTHTATDCQPVQDAHTHGASDPGAVGSTTSALGSSSNFATPLHTHTWTVDAATATNNAVAVTIDNCTADAALPKHRTVIYVQFAGSAPGPAVGCYTSYNYLWAGEHLGSGPLPEVAAAIARGDRRYMRQEEPV